MCGLCSHSSTDACLARESDSLHNVTHEHIISSQRERYFLTETEGKQHHTKGRGRGKQSHTKKMGQWKLHHPREKGNPTTLLTPIRFVLIQLHNLNLIWWFFAAVCLFFHHVVDVSVSVYLHQTAQNWCSSIACICSHWLPSHRRFRKASIIWWSPVGSRC